MITEALPDEAEPAASAEPELPGPVLDVLRTLLGDHQERDAVLSIVSELVARNTDLERRFARMAARYKPSEQVSKAQLVLFLDALKRRQGEPTPEGEAIDEHAALVAADDELRAVSGIDGGEDDDVSKQRTPPPPRQPRSPTPPAHLRRVNNPIAVPAEQRACPTCGGDLQCVEPHVTEVIELLPPEVIVRRDIREQLTCASCDGESVRAPAGQTVVPNGKLGLGLVASIPAASKLGVALRYFTNHQAALARFLEYGFLPLDNGIVERLHVRTALTRKNFLLAGSDAGGERAAIAYTILGSCRLACVDPREYLADVLPRLTGRIRFVDLPSLLPSRWAAQRAACAAAAAQASRMPIHFRRTHV